MAQQTDCAFREARTKLSRRPWRVDTFDELAQKWFSCSTAEALPDDGVPHSPFRRVIMFVDNAGEPAVRLQKAVAKCPRTASPLQRLRLRQLPRAVLHTHNVSEQKAPISKSCVLQKAPISKSCVLHSGLTEKYLYVCLAVWRVSRQTWLSLIQRILISLESAVRSLSSSFLSCQKAALCSAGLPHGAGADVVLGMIPLARELLRMGSEVVMVANSLPAINDVTTAELRTLLDSVCDICPVLKVTFKLLRSCLQVIC